MASIVRRRVIVSGRVQGVNFRAHTRSAAQRLGVTGWVRNRSDGSVEALVEGAPEVVQSLLVWIKKGPPFSRVDSVKVTDEDPSGEFHDFQITFENWEFWRGR